MASTETTPAVAERTETAPLAALADPAPLGLAGFAATTLVLSFVNTGIIGVTAVSAVLALAFFYGGLAQLLAGILEYRRGNTFGVTAFGTYGAFWLAFALYIWQFKGTPLGQATGMFLLVFAVVTAYLTLAALRLNGALVVVLTLLTLTFVVLTIAAFANSAGIGKVGGWIGIVTAVAAFYTSAAIVVNSTWRRPMLPVFPL
jgi:succinate-acetate transporter protein